MKDTTAMEREIVRLIWMVLGIFVAVRVAAFIAQLLAGATNYIAEDSGLADLLSNLNSLNPLDILVQLVIIEAVVIIYYLGSKWLGRLGKHR